MIKHEIVSFPLYVWKNHSKYISEKELIALGHLQCVPSTKKGWTIASENMGYKSLAPLSAIISKLVEKEMITVERYVINALPLYNACLDVLPTTEIQPKQKEQKIEYQIAGEIKRLGVTQTIHQLAATIKKLNGTREEIVECYRTGIWLQENGFFRSVNLNTLVFTLIDIDWKIELDLLHWMQSANDNWTAKKGQPSYPVQPKALTTTNYQRWIDSGKPNNFTDNKKKELADI